MASSEPPSWRTLGRPAADSRRVGCATELPQHPTSTRLVPVLLRGEAALPQRFTGPAMLRGLAEADGLAVVPPGGVPPGGSVDFLPLPRPR